MTKTQKAVVVGSVEALVALGAVALGILALVGLEPLKLVLVGQLAVGATLLASSLSAGVATGRGRPLESRLALVTGGARGIGRGIAIELLRAGARVVIGDLVEQEMDRTCRELAKEGPAHWVKLDVSDHDAMRAAVDAIRREHGPIEILVNNAGIAGAGLFAEKDSRRIAKELVVDLAAPVCLSHMVLPHMIEARWGRIANISSMMAFTGSPGFAVYSAAKAGVFGFSTAIERELRSMRDVHVTVVLPPSVRTSAFEEAKHTQAKMMRWRMVPPISVEQVARRTVHGLIRGRRQIYCSAQSYLASLLQRLFPWLMDALLMFMFRDGARPRLPTRESPEPASHA
jgi:3-oxoacyl-[acyl-carrier protein] reductase